MNSTRKNLIIQHKHPVHKGPLHCFTKLHRSPVQLGEGIILAHSAAEEVPVLQQTEAAALPTISAVLGEAPQADEYLFDEVLHDRAMLMPAEELFGEGTSSGPYWAEGVDPCGLAEDEELIALWDE